MKVEQNIRAIMPILMDKGFTRAEKEYHIKKLVERITQVAWQEGYNQRPSAGWPETDWLTWWKSVTEEKQVAVEKKKTRPCTCTTETQKSWCTKDCDEDV